jgi:hypothetical protein
MRNHAAVAGMPRQQRRFFPLTREDADNQKQQRSRRFGRRDLFVGALECMTLSAPFFTPSPL